MFVKFPTPVKGHDDAYSYGPETFVDPQQVVAVAPKVYQYHSFRPAQNLAVITLATGDSITVFATVDEVMKAITAPDDEGKFQEIET